jgi:hypothetical protein
VTPKKMPNRTEVVIVMRDARGASQVRKVVCGRAAPAAEVNDVGVQWGDP